MYPCQNLDLGVCLLGGPGVLYALMEGFWMHLLEPKENSWKVPLWNVPAPALAHALQVSSGQSISQLVAKVKTQFFILAA